MFVRIKKYRGTLIQSVLICHNQRLGKQVKQIVVKCLGHSRDEMQLQAWAFQARCWIKEKGAKWLKQLEEGKVMRRHSRKISLTDLMEEKRINVGIEDIFGRLYDYLGFDQLLSKRFQSLLKKIIFSRLLEPSSKRRLSQVCENYLGFSAPVNRIYRLMDKLMEQSAAIEKMIFETTKKALKGHLSIVLFDVTTLWFETVSEDELRTFGFSKDCKINTTQVVLALATTQEGLPIGYQLFPGNMAESKTLIECINGWKKQVNIDKVTIIGDRAMMSEANLLALETSGFYYVVAFPLRKTCQSMKKLILDRASYKFIESSEELKSYRLIDQGKRKLIVTYSEKRAKKDAKDRERLVKKLEKKLQTCKNVKRLVNTKGYLKYTEILGEATASINNEKISEDAQWDGLHGVITNKPVVDHKIYEDYRRLWIIEESFRIQKHDLKTRPIYHFTPNRIRAHILLCYMVFTLVRHVQFQLNQVDKPMSVFRIIEALRQVQASILRDTVTGDRYKLLSALSSDAEIIYKLFGIEQTLTSVQIM